MSLEISLQTAEECLRISHILQGHFQVLTDEKESVEIKVQKAKKWLSRQPDYLKFLQHLQSALHQKNIGAFSELLTYFVKDVLKKDKDIVFDLYTYHKLPALRIEALNDGCRESIYEGNGGSIANIVSTGLRLIALSRLQHRKFIVLDEPDCWLKPDHVPIFAKIIGEISEKLKIQTIIISHHDWNYFKDYGRVIELASDGKNLEATIVHDTPFEEDENADYIRSIRMRQFMSHQDTEYKLHPYLTCLIGENDIGKSVLATAVKAVSYNDSSDSYIKHHTDEGQVLFELSKKRQILWQRFRVTTQDNPQKVKYSLFVDGGLVTSEFNSSDVPRFISKELNILTTEDIDIHVGNQKQPVFLLSSDVKPQERAKILSLGKESLIIQKMMENIKTKTRQNKQTVKEGEERYDTLNKQLQVLSNIEDLVNKAEINKAEHFGLSKQLEGIGSLTIILEQILTINEIVTLTSCNLDIKEPKLKECNNLESLVSSMDLQISIGQIDDLNQNLPIIELKQTIELEKQFKRLYLVKQGASINEINIDLVEPKISNTQELVEIIQKMMISEKLNNLSNINYELTSAIKVKDLNEISSLISQIKIQNELLLEYQIKQDNLKVWEKNINAEIEEFLNNNQSICPTCHQVIDKKHFSGENHA